jgi:hypothetical protein
MMHEFEGEAYGVRAAAVFLVEFWLLSQRGGDGEAALAFDWRSRN